MFDFRDYRGHADDKTIRYMMEIPFLIYLSDTTKNKYPELGDKIKSSLNRPYMTDDIIHTILDIVGIETKEGKDVGIFGGIGSKYHRPYGSGKEEYYVENLLEEIDHPGEWCIDFTTQKLYLFPPEHFDENLLSIVSDTTPLINIINSNHIKIENISFKNHLGDGVIIKNATECLIAGCNFKNILGDALIIQGGKQNRIQSNNFEYIRR